MLFFHRFHSNKAAHDHDEWRIVSGWQKYFSVPATAKKSDSTRMCRRSSVEKIRTGIFSVGWREKLMTSKTDSPRESNLEGRRFDANGYQHRWRRMRLETDVITEVSRTQTNTSGKSISPMGSTFADGYETIKRVFNHDCHFCIEQQTGRFRRLCSLDKFKRKTVWTIRKQSPKASTRSSI